MARIGQNRAVSGERRPRRSFAEVYGTLQLAASPQLDLTVVQTFIIVQTGSLYLSKNFCILNDGFAMCGYQLELILISPELNRVLFCSQSLSLRDPVEDGNIEICNSRIEI